MTEPVQDAAPVGLSSIADLIGKGAPGGVCELDDSAAVPLARLPMSVGGGAGLTYSAVQTITHSMMGDDVLHLAFPGIWERASGTSTGDVYFTNADGVRRFVGLKDYTADYYLHTTSVGATQWASVEVTSASQSTANAMHGVILRAGNDTTSGNRNGILIVFWNASNGADGRASIGSFTSRTNVTWLRTVPAAVVGSGDVLRAQVLDSTVSVTRNGTPIVSYAGPEVASASGGRVGIYVGNDGRIKNFKAGTITAPMALQDPLVVKLSTQYTNPANTDLFAGGNWAQALGVGGVFATGGSSAVAGYTSYARCAIPATGWYRSEFSCQSTATSGTAAIKILARTDSTAPSVTTDSIASDLKTAGGEGAPLYATALRYFTAGTIIYWSTWASASSVIKPAHFGGLEAVFTLTRIR
ncbi:MAG: hypothetical protein QM658_09660 [Gordonia sp. (in: high G+C Gram-positive bacteria)]